MQYWQLSGLGDLLWLLALVAVAHRIFGKALERLAVPPVLVAGFIGLGLGQSGLGLIPLHGEALEPVVYHGIAIVFIALGLSKTRSADPPTEPLFSRLRSAARQHREAVSIAIAIPLFSLAQAALGLSFVLAWTASASPVHPGLGLMLPLGFSQGPGQALSLGKAWESMGFESGAQVGLVMATLGYLWCCILGIGLVQLARAKGWVDAVPQRATSATTSSDDVASEGVDPLTSATALVCAVYLVTFLVLTALTEVLANDPQLVAMIWGFHFLVGLVVALLARALLGRLGGGQVGRLQTERVGGLAVDLTAAAAVAAVQLDKLGGDLVPALVLSALGALGTAAACVWIARRAFGHAPLAHTLVLFGSLTGTLPTGLALLRLVDPRLEGPAARNTITGITGATVLGAPILLVILPSPTNGWPESYPGAVWSTLGLIAAYGCLLAIGWYRSGALRLLRPLGSPWPEAPVTDLHRPSDRPS